jgi:hypothetical protein
MNEQTNVGPDSATPAGKRPGSARGTAFKVAALVLTTLCLVIGAACWLRNSEKAADPPPQGASEDPSGLFFKWPEPLFAVVLSAQEHGYLQPCGCSDPQYGGLERRYNFIQSLRLPKDKGGRGWPVVTYDLGDIIQTEAPAKLPNLQALIKYRYSMLARQIMGYSAVSFGESEAAQGLSFVIDEYALNENKPPILAANLRDKDKHFPADDDDKHPGPEWGKSYVGSWQVTQVTPDVKVSALGIIGTHHPDKINELVTKGLLPKGISIPPSVGLRTTEMNPKIKFVSAADAIPVGLKAMKARNPDFRVLLYQGPVELAKLIPLADPDFNVILCLSQEDEPPGRPEVVKNAKGGETFVIRVGHKGKHVGVVGVFRPKPGAPLEMKYQLVPMGPTYKTPAAEAKGQPIIDLMEHYTAELKRDDFLAKYARAKIPHSTQATIKITPKLAALGASGYAGSDTCRKCHDKAYKIWKDTDHHKAYATLTGDKAKHPSLREYDPECVVCHTVGFRYQGGFANAKDTPNLKDVGCESCHGPSEIHVKNPNNAALYALINPWRAPEGETPAQKTKRELRIEGMCRQCHDSENDVTWKAYAPKWAKIVHMND